MIDVNWDLAPEGAVAVGQRKDALAFTDEDDHVFLNGHWGISMGWKTIAKRPTFAELMTKTPTQTKTVADAVEQEKHWRHDRLPFLAWNSITNKFVYGSSAKCAPHEQYVCTRAEFEAYVKEQEGEKWTHAVEGATKCILLCTHGDTSWVLEEGDVYETYFSSCIEPIKPTISESEAWRLVSEDGAIPSFIKRNYDVVKG